MSDEKIVNHLPIGSIAFGPHTQRDLARLLKPSPCPACAQKDAEIAEKRGLVRDLTAHLEQRNAEIARLTARWEKLDHNLSVIKVLDDSQWQAGYHAACRAILCQMRSLDAERGEKV